jgi:hypothetical protein
MVIIFNEEENTQAETNETSCSDASALTSIHNTGNCVGEIHRNSESLPQ